MDPVRSLIVARVTEQGKTLKGVSEAIGRSHAYLQQFIKRGVPAKLPEDIRGPLAEELGLDEASLGAPPKKATRRQNLAQGDLFALREVDLRAGASFGGGIDQGEWNEPAEGGTSTYAHRAVAEWMLPRSYARQELSLSPGQADILPVKGDSMDDGTTHGLLSGDRVIVDLTDVDARQGAIFAVWDGGGVIIKQVEIVRGSDPVMIVCSSLNKRYKPIELTVDGDVHIIGRVAAKISRM